MRTAKIAITMDGAMVKTIDSFVKQHIFPNRSQAIQQAVKEKIERLERSKLAKECAKLDPRAERAMAEEGLNQDLAQWPEY